MWRLLSLPSGPARALLRHLRLRLRRFCPPLAFVFGSYALTIAKERSCVNSPPALRLRQCDVVIDRSYGPYAPVRVADSRYPKWPNCGLWSTDRASSGTTLTLGCDYPEAVAGSPSLYMCGDGKTAFLEGTRPGTACTAPLHFEMHRQP